jgi:hypothetical protein
VGEEVAGSGLASASIGDGGHGGGGLAEQTAFGQVGCTSGAVVALRV